MSIMSAAQQNIAANQGGYAQPFGGGSQLQALAGDITGQMTDNFNRSVMPGMGSGLMAAGGYGGSRHGVLQANAQNDLQRQIGSALANLYGQGYQADQQYDLGLRNNALGWGGVGAGIENANTAANATMTAASTSAGASMHNAQLAHQLGLANLDRNINNDNLGWQLQGANFGLGLYDRQQASNQGIYGVGTTIQNQPLDYWSQFSNSANSLGNGFADGSAVPQAGNPIMGALGGMQAGQRLGSYWGSGNNWAGGGSNPNVPGDAYMPAYQSTGFTPNW